MAEKSEELCEQDPNYKKKAQWFGLAAILLLCITLIFSVFVGGGKRNNRQKEKLPIDNVRTADGSQHDLQEKIRQERIKRHRQMEIGSNRGQDNQDPMQSIIHRKSVEETARIETKEEPPSLEDEFRQQEKRRALKARQSSFGLQSNRGFKTASVQPTGLNNSDAKRDRILNEQKRIEQKLSNLEGLRSKGHKGSQSLGLGGNQTSGAKQASGKPITVGRPASEAEPTPGQYLMPTGAVVDGVLDQKLMSDYSGPFRAMVSKDVYDVSGNHILIPKGSRVTGRSLRISNVNEPIQARMGLIVKWCVLPDGNRISFEKRVASLDQEGVPAIKDKVNYHFIPQFLGVAAYALLSSETSRQGSGYSNDQTFEGQMGESLRKQFAPLAAKYLNLVPTITLRIGTPMKIILEDDVYAYPWASLGQKLYQANQTAY